MTEADPAHVRLVEQIAERGNLLRRRVAELTDRDVTIVCVTKGHAPDVAVAAFEAGFRDLGESYAQELRDKAPTVAAGGARPRWHFVGRLQTNKVRLVSEVVDLWQSVDRPSVAEQIAQRSAGASVLVQVDLAGLEGRGGCRPDEVAGLVRTCADSGLVVRGLMGVGPPGDPEDSRVGFRRLDRLATELGLEERSMGMSGDLEVAVQEGATIIRVGSALVGPRP